MCDRDPRPWAWCPCLGRSAGLSPDVGLIGVLGHGELGVTLDTGLHLCKFHQKVLTSVRTITSTLPGHTGSRGIEQTPRVSWPSHPTGSVAVTLRIPHFAGDPRQQPAPQPLSKRGSLKEVGGRGLHPGGSWTRRDGDLRAAPGAPRPTRPGTPCWPPVTLETVRPCALLFPDPTGLEPRAR